MQPLTHLDPLLVWGIFTRLVGVVCLISFGSLVGQVVPAAGRMGGAPFYMRLNKFREDFPTWRRFFYFPTLLWLDDSDRTMRLLAWVGIAASASIVYGGPFTPYAFFVCYLSYLSLDLATALIFPWDCLLFETMLLGIFLPPIHNLPELTATATPPPLLTWAFRILVFRVMFGFGKLKFLGSTKQDWGYLKGFLTAQPLPSYIGWYAQKLPLFMLQGMLFFMIFVELPAPFFVFFPGLLSEITAVSVTLLMIGIQSMGSFGYFSILTITDCVPLLDNTTPLTVDWSHLFGVGQPNITNAYVIVHSLLAIVAFPFNSWIGQSWLLWSFYYRIKARWVVWPFELLRVLHPFRWLHPYGVFPPKAYPEVKGSVLMEVSWDGTRWLECEFVFFPSNDKSKPKFVAPYHPRGDQAVIYETYGMNPGSMIASLAGPWDPYAYGTVPGVQAFLQRIVDGNGGRYLKIPEIEKHGTPPKYSRAVAILLEPETLSEHFKTGNYWRRSYLGPHAPPFEYDPEFWNYVMPEPEMWHWESIAWRRRSKLKTLIARARAGEEPNTAVIADVEQLTPEHVELFWNDFVPTVGLEDRRSWDNLPGTLARLKAKYDRKTLRTLQRLLGRFGVALAERLEPHYLGHGFKNPPIPVKTYLHLWMLIDHVIGSGREAYEAVYREPLSAVAYIPDMTFHTGTYYLSIFRFDQMCFDAQKLRLMRAVMGPYTDDGLPENLGPTQQKVVKLLQNLFGYFELGDEMIKYFKGPAFDHGYSECYPTFRVAPSGEVKLVSRGAAAPKI